MNNKEIFKPLNDFIALERTVLTTYRALTTWRNVHEVSAIADLSNNNYVFDRLAKVHNGECSYMVDSLTKLDLNNTGVKDVDDIIPYWENFLKTLVGNIKFYVSYFSKYKSEFESYPIFLKNQSYFITEKLYDYFLEYINKDADDASLIQRSEITANRK